MSIVCQESLDLDTLTGIFAHEIKHGLFAIKEQRHQKHTENSNWKKRAIKTFMHKPKQIWSLYTF